MSLAISARISRTPYWLSLPPREAERKPDSKIFSWAKIMSNEVGNVTKIWRRRVLLVANAHVLLSCVFNHFGGLLHPVKNSCPCSQTPLSGVMPPQLGDLDALQVLHLRYNKFEGKLSRSPLRYCRTSLFPFVANFRGLGESFLEKCRVRINSAAFVHFLSSLTYYPYIHIVGCADKDCCVRQYKLDSCISKPPYPLSALTFVLPFVFVVKILVWSEYSVHPCITNHHTLCPRF